MFICIYVNMYSTCMCIYTFIDTCMQAYVHNVVIVIIYIYMHMYSYVCLYLLTCKHRCEYLHVLDLYLAYSCVKLD